MIKGVIFDLDGTLCDTIYDLADSVNYALLNLGYPTHSPNIIKTFVGHGIENLIKSSLPCGEKDENILKKALELFFEYYKVHFADKTKAFDGINELLARLKQRGIRLAVCTNKEDGMAKAVTEKLFKGYFDMVIGQGDRFPLKPAPDSTLYIIEQMGISLNETVFIGDSDVDVITAKNSKVRSVGVTWGFRDKKELLENGCEEIAEHPSDIIKIIDGVKE